MSETDVNPAEPKKTTGWYVKNGVLLVIILILVGFIVYMFGEFQTRNEYNRIVNTMMNEQQYEEAISAFEDLRPGVDEEMQGKIDSDIAFCYVQLAQDPSRPLTASKSYLEKAHELDESQLSAADLRILQMTSRRSNSPAEPAEPAEPESPETVGAESTATE